ncbi:MAG: response regulator transcription factor [Chloroflexi bacterium]|nr:response regulator transcription factor [Chloroflexota bacterium]MCY3979319.1 response regulator transcription factor [Chloroflexota bacterium]
MAKERNILVVDDERTIREVVRRYLELEGFAVTEAETGPQALSILHDSRPDLIVLDIMLPGIDGFSITRRLRHDTDYSSLQIEGDIPIILLTARTNEVDRVAGLELGADDYVIKPFSPRELVARVKRILQRASPPKAESEIPLQYAGLRLDPRSRAVSVDDKPVSLTAKEFDLLWFLLRHPQHVFTREQLLQNVWGYEFEGYDSTVTVHVRRLREKLEPNPSAPSYIKTVWGVGYKIEAPAAE